MDKKKARKILQKADKVHALGDRVIAAAEKPTVEDGIADAERAGFLTKDPMDDTVQLTEKGVAEAEKTMSAVGDGFGQAVESLKRSLQDKGWHGDQLPGLFPGHDGDGKEDLNTLKMYHYTASAHMRSILENGIRPGDVPLAPAGQEGLFDLFPLQKGMGVNLTTDPDFRNQGAWGQGSTADKSEVRIEVAIPVDEVTKNLYLWNFLCRTIQEHFGDQKFRVPDGFEYTDDGWMKRDEKGFPIVAEWSDTYLTLRQWHKRLNALAQPTGAEDKWWIYNGTIPTEWIVHALTKKEALTEWPDNQIEYIRETPSQAIAWTENLSARCYAEAHKIAATSTTDDGDTWSENGIQHLSAHIAKSSLYLWKSSLLAGAGNGCEVFDGTIFDVELPTEGVLFLADKQIAVDLLDAEGKQTVERFDALMLQHVNIQNGKVAVEGRDGQTIEIPWLRKPKNPAPMPDGLYVSGLMFLFFGGLAGEICLKVKAIPLWRVGNECRGWGSLLKALFMFMEQKIVGVDTHGPPRPERRRMKKERKPIWDVKVISLRRYAQSGIQGDGHGAVDWQCQWTVSGHWRKQPTNEGVKVIWIDPYIKGPDDKPLRDPTKSIFSVRR